MPPDFLLRPAGVPFNAPFQDDALRIGGDVRLAPGGRDLMSGGIVVIVPAGSGVRSRYGSVGGEALPASSSLDPNIDFARVRQIYNLGRGTFDVYKCGNIPTYPFV